MKTPTNIKQTPTVKKGVDAAMETGITHTTPADGNIFLDLGFKPEEAEAFLKESQLIIGKKIGLV